MKAARPAIVAAVDFTTYRKGNYEPLDESEFETVSLSIPGQPAAEYEPAGIRVTGDLVEVHLDQQSAPRHTHAMPSLCQHLNALCPRLPETPYDPRFHTKSRRIGKQSRQFQQPDVRF